MRDWKDRLGIFASAACAVHCAATPFLVATLPTLKFTEWMADPSFHQIAAVICCSLVAIAIVPAALRFRDVRLLAVASAGLGLILTAAFLVPDSCCSINATPASTNTSQASHDHSHHDHSHDHHAHSSVDHRHDANQEHALGTSTAEAHHPTLLMAGVNFAHPWMTPVGGLLLIVAHAMNMRRRWKSECGFANCCPARRDADLLPLPEPPTCESTLARAS